MKAERGTRARRRLASSCWRCVSYSTSSSGSQLADASHRLKTLFCSRSFAMRLDIRYPIGWLFAIMGLIMIVFGLASVEALYAKSLDINVNLWWGLVMLVFGSVMRLLAKGAGGSS